MFEIGQVASRAFQVCGFGALFDDDLNGLALVLTPPAAPAPTVQESKDPGKRTLVFGPPQRYASSVPDLTTHDRLETREDPMPKYLLKASYNAEGVRGVMKDGGTKREAAARALMESLGGKVEAFYYCHGDADVIVICDFPDTARALAGVMAVNASGLVAASTTPLITPAEVDAAAKLHGTYRAPGA